MLNSLQLWPFYRDTWGYYGAIVNPILAPLDHNTCYRPKFYNAPDLGVASMVPGAYLRYTLGITPGSLIWGIWNDDQAPLFSCQVTDISTSHQLWDAPISNYFLTNFNGHTAGGVEPIYPNLLCAPYPVVGSGQFDVEIQETSGSAQRIELVIGVLEVCYVG